MLTFAFYHETLSGDCPTYSVHKTETLKETKTKTKTKQY